MKPTVRPSFGRKRPGTPAWISLRAARNIAAGASRSFGMHEFDRVPAIISPVISQDGFGARTDLDHDAGGVDDQDQSCDVSKMRRRSYDLLAQRLLGPAALGKVAAILEAPMISPDED